MTPRRARLLMLTAGLVTLMAPILACGAGDDGHTTYPLAACGMQIELGSHFTQTASGPSHFAFSDVDGTSIVEIDLAPSAEAPSAREPATLVPLATSYDYDRASTIAGFTAREVRTQAPMGAMIRSRWGAAIETPRGRTYLRVTNLLAEGPEVFGEGFWTALHNRWLTPL